MANTNGSNRNGHTHPASGSVSNMRIPTVHEALPYSPFSSIIPFSPGTMSSPFPILAVDYLHCFQLPQQFPNPDTYN